MSFLLRYFWDPLHGCISVNPSCFVCVQKALRWVAQLQFKYDDTRIGPLILLIFFGSLLFGNGYVYLFIPETKGLWESHSCKSMNFIARALNLGTFLSGNHILVKCIRSPSKTFIKCKRRRGPLKVLRLHLVNDLTTANFSSTTDMNV